jgi:hypothetical protein
MQAVEWDACVHGGWCQVHLRPWEGALCLTWRKSPGLEARATGTKLQHMAMNWRNKPTANRYRTCQDGLFLFV